MFGYGIEKKTNEGFFQFCVVFFSLWRKKLKIRLKGLQYDTSIDQLLRLYVVPGLCGKKRNVKRKHTALHYKILF